MANNARTGGCFPFDRPQDVVFMGILAIINIIKNTRGETSNGEKQNSSNHDWKKHTNELPAAERSPGNAEPD